MIVRTSVFIFEYSLAFFHLLFPAIMTLDIELPEKVKLTFMEKVPQYTAGVRPPKMAKRINLMRGPENIHNEFIYKQYGIVVIYL